MSPYTTKTWTGFKYSFGFAHNEWRKSQSTTISVAFHSANHLQEKDTTQLYQKETVNAIANRATATTASNCATVTTLTATNSTLTLALTACQLQYVEALQDVAKLATVIADIKKTQRKAIQHHKLALLLDSWVFL